MGGRDRVAPSGATVTRYALAWGRDTRIEERKGVRCDVCTTGLASVLHFHHRREWSDARGRKTPNAPKWPTWQPAILT